MARVYVAAAHKSSGKTSLAVGLTAALAGRGMAVQPFKKGPDYIDPIWLTQAAGRPCHNLDFFTQSAAEIQDLFATQSETAEISVIEGNKGLFDGLAVDGSDSNAAMAALLSAPVVLVIDCTGMTRGIAPLVCGYQGFEPKVDILGVILNKVGGERHESKLRAALERYTDLEVLGALGREADLQIPERHLGLIPANEYSVSGGDGGSAARIIGRLSAAVTRGVDLDRVLAIARAAAAQPPGTSLQARMNSSAGSAVDVRIAVARDAAFGFYYADDLEAFARAGAELVFFDALSDGNLPQADGLWIGGGFPETQLTALSANRSLLGDIRRALADGMPAYAECGGLMYLSRSIRWRGQESTMVGTIPADVVVGDRPQGKGYMLLDPTPDHPWPPATGNGSDVCSVPAHEFHYARLENLPPNLDFAWRVARGSGIDGSHDGIIIGNLIAGFSHQRDTAANHWVHRFLSFVREKAR